MSGNVSNSSVSQMYLSVRDALFPFHMPDIPGVECGPSIVFWLKHKMVSAIEAHDATRNAFNAIKSYITHYTLQLCNRLQIQSLVFFNWTKQPSKLTHRALWSLISCPSGFYPGTSPILNLHKWHFLFMTSYYIRTPIIY